MKQTKFHFKAKVGVEGKSLIDALLMVVTAKN